MEIKVSLDGLARPYVKVHVYYSDKLAEVNTLDGAEPNGRASCKSEYGGKLGCTFIFPHTIHDKPNILWTDELAGREPRERITKEETEKFDEAARAARMVGAPFPKPPFDYTDNHPKAIGAPAIAHARVVIEYHQGAKRSKVIDQIRSFRMPRNLVIANLGDSYASGEGAPNKEHAPAGQRWDDAACHRSSKGGQIRAIKAFRLKTPDVAMVYFNAACSGAEIDDGLLGPQTELPQKGATKPGQIRALAEWMNEHNRPTVDLLLLSAGGNNAGFGVVGVSCLGALTSDCRSDEQLWKGVRTRIRELPSAYADLANRIADLSVGRVFITQYPDPTRTVGGEFCNTPGSAYPGLCWGPVELAVSANEFEAIRDRLIVPLNEAVRSAAAAHQWALISGTVPLSEKRGLCSSCDDPAFNTLGRSFDNQGDYFGTIHPTRTGYREIYEPPVLARFESHLKDLKRDAAIDIAKEKAREKAEQALSGKTGFVKDARALLPPSTHRAHAPLPAPTAALPDTDRTTPKERPVADDAIDLERPADDPAI